MLYLFNDDYQDVDDNDDDSYDYVLHDNFYLFIVIIIIIDSFIIVRIYIHSVYK